MVKRFSEEQVQERYQRMLVYQQSKITICPVSISELSLDTKVAALVMAQDLPYRRFAGEVDQVYAARVCIGLCSTHHRFP
ncbi:MAG: hypothetical protein WCI72_01530 [archaeon]